MKNKKSPKEKAELWSSVKRDAKSSIQKKIQFYNKKTQNNVNKAVQIRGGYKTNKLEGQRSLTR